ncbi:uncharacterized protein KRP23_3565 [Phytophthora ramorum]|uniref:uncharacterized protein n=1 Tax=Phytophthora ramorum TaxID=164328 RepID=UPI0030B48C0B|nr:hypothetical protein KRP23_3565 [Phytophthora ramorum]
MMISLHSYSETIAKVSESKDELPAFRAVALADVWNCAHSLDSISSRVLGLEKVSKLIMALDDEIRSHALERNLEDDIVAVSDAEEPRSKDGGVVPETALVGSKSWKGNLLRVLLDSQGDFDKRELPGHSFPARADVRS